MSPETVLGKHRHEQALRLTCRLATAGMLGSGLGLFWVFKGAGDLPSALFTLGMLLSCLVVATRSDEHKAVRIAAPMYCLLSASLVWAFAASYRVSFWLDRRAPLCFSLTLSNLYYLEAAWQAGAIVIGLVIGGAGAWMLSREVSWWQRVRLDVDASDQLLSRTGRWCVLVGSGWSLCNEVRWVYAWPDLRHHCGTPVGGVAMTGFAIAVAGFALAFHRERSVLRKVSAVLNREDAELGALTCVRVDGTDRVLVRGDTATDQGSWMAIREIAEGGSPYRADGGSDLLVSKGAPQILAGRVEKAATWLALSIALLAAQGVRVATTHRPPAEELFRSCDCRQQIGGESAIEF